MSNLLATGLWAADRTTQNNEVHNFAPFPTDLNGTDRPQAIVHRIIHPSGPVSWSQASEQPDTQRSSWISRPQATWQLKDLHRLMHIHRYSAKAHGQLWRFNGNTINNLLLTVVEPNCNHWPLPTHPSCHIYWPQEALGSTSAEVGLSIVLFRLPSTQTRSQQSFETRISFWPVDLF